MLSRLYDLITCRHFSDFYQELHLESAAFVFNRLITNVRTPLEDYDSFLLQYPSFVHDSIVFIHDSIVFTIQSASEFKTKSSVLESPLLTIYNEMCFQMSIYYRTSKYLRSINHVRLYYVQIAEKFIRAGHSVHHLIDRPYHLKQFFQGSYIFIFDDHDFIALLIRSGLSIDHLDVKGNTALHNACYNQNFQKVHQLLRLGANPLLVSYDFLSLEHNYMCVSDRIAACSLLSLIVKAQRLRHARKVSLFSLLLPLIYIHCV